ncbi:MAG: hypothetical protein IJW63_12170 [Lachnospiraceae bacterium]|nr:hypothetical protein [Lachnospiraceae bacterium]
MSIESKVLKRKNFICFLLIAVILLSGVCFETIKAQSFFGYATEHQADAFVKNIGVKLVTSCSNETLGLRNSRFSTQNGQNWNPIRRVLRTLVLEISFVEQFGDLSTFFSTAHLVAFEKKHPKAEVLFFIHESDGKKRA